MSDDDFEIEYSDDEGYNYQDSQPQDTSTRMEEDEAEGYSSKQSASLSVEGVRNAVSRLAPSTPLDAIAAVDKPGLVVTHTSSGIPVLSQAVDIAEQGKRMMAEVAEVQPLLGVEDKDVVLLALASCKFQKETLQDKWYGADAEDSGGASSGPSPQDIFLANLGLMTNDASRAYYSHSSDGSGNSGGGAAKAPSCPPKDGSCNAEYDAATDTFMCAATLDSLPGHEFACMPCGHWFSKGAWASHLRSFIEADPNTAALSTRCMQDGCRELATPSFFREILTGGGSSSSSSSSGAGGAGSSSSSSSSSSSDSDSNSNRAFYDRYYSFLVRSFIAKNASVSLCPVKGCDQVLSAAPAGRASAGAGSLSSSSFSGRKSGGGGGRLGAADVTCAKGHVFCFVCLYEGGHEPCVCSDMRRWKADVLKEHAGDLLFIKKNYKQCPNPKCGAAIERVTGCNKVVCKDCQVAFCWNCLRFPFTDHHKYPQEAWDCSKPPLATDLNDPKDLQLQLWAFQGFNNHNDAMNLLTREDHVTAFDATVLDIKDYFSLSDREVGQINEAEGTLLTAEKSIKASYVKSYYALKRLNAMDRAIQTKETELKAVSDEGKLKALDQAAQEAGGRLFMLLEEYKSEESKRRFGEAMASAAADARARAAAAAATATPAKGGAAKGKGGKRGKGGNFRPPAKAPVISAATAAAEHEDEEADDGDGRGPSSAERSAAAAAAGHTNPRKKMRHDTGDDESDEGEGVTVASLRLAAAGAGAGAGAGAASSSSSSTSSSSSLTSSSSSSSADAAASFTSRPPHVPESEWEQLTAALDNTADNAFLFNLLVDSYAPAETSSEPAGAAAAAPAVAEDGFQAIPLSVRIKSSRDRLKASLLELTNAKRARATLEAELPALRESRIKFASEVNLMRNLVGIMEGHTELLHEKMKIASIKTTLKLPIPFAHHITSKPLDPKPDSKKFAAREGKPVPATGIATSPSSVAAGGAGAASSRLAAVSTAAPREQTYSSSGGKFPDRTPTASAYILKEHWEPFRNEIYNLGRTLRDTIQKLEHGFDSENL